VAPVTTSPDRPDPALVPSTTAFAGPTRHPQIVAALAGVGAVVVGATAYASLSVRGIVPMTAGVFLAWLAALQVSHAFLGVVVLIRRRELSLRAKLVAVYWAGVAFWYWLPAPIYFLLTMNIDQLQLSWTALIYFWEVPVLGAAFISLVLWFYPGHWRRVKAPPVARYRRVLRYPAVAAGLVFAFTLVGYTLGALQLRRFGLLPAVEQAKTVLHGVVISLLLGVFYHLALDALLEPLRSAIAREGHLGPQGARTTAGRMLGVSLAVTVSGFALVSLFVLQAFQRTVQASVAETLEREVVDLAGVAPREVRVALADHRARGDRDELFLLAPGAALSPFDYSPETRVMVSAGGHGVVSDTRRDLKIVAFAPGAQGATLVAVAYLTDFYGPLQGAAELLGIAGTCVLIVTIGMLGFAARASTRALRSLASAVRSVEAGSADEAGLRVHTADEIEALSDVVARYVRQSRDLHENLESKVREKTAELSAKLEEIERTDAALSRSAQRLEALQHIDRSILAAESPEGIASAALPRLRRVVPCAWAAVLTFEGDLAQVMVVDGAAPFSEGTTLHAGDLPAPQVLPMKGIRYLDDLTPLRGCFPVFDRLLAVGTRSLISAPLAVDGRAVGLLAVAGVEPGAFDSDQAEIVGEVANQLAVAIHQAGLRRALDLQQARLSAMMEHLPEGVLLLDGTHHVVLANAAARANFPLVARLNNDGRVERVAERSLADLLAAPADGAPLEARVDQKILQFAARRLDTFPGAILVVRDITSERTAHAAAERQARLAAVGQLAAGIAHDFNNILMTIISCAEMALRRPAELELHSRWLTTITDQGHHAAALVRQILDFSRQSTAHLRPVDLGALVLETAGLLERTLPETIRIVPEVVAGCFVINADPNQLGQVLTNLAVNARDAMPSGGELRVVLSELTVSPGERPTPDLTPGRWAVLSVSDTGTGMPPEVRERIFEPFFTTKPPGRGTGLGLSQVYGIVKQHQGEILVESQPGMGTTFKLFLPLLPDPAPADGGAGRTTAAGGRGETLLVVEDNAGLRAALSETLTGLGYRVLTASSGEDGLALYERHHEDIQLVLSDLVMPGMDGVSLVRALRRRNPATKVVIMSGYLGESANRQTIDGVLAWVQKPGRPQELATVIRRALAHTAGAPEPLLSPASGRTPLRQEKPN
jgi:signal transduction histidine kinase/CheY-like chemotaxis protein/HAMP domain-containing protein